MEARLILGVVTVEKQGGLVRGAKEGVGHRGATKAINHCSRLQVSTAHLHIVVDGLSGEVKKLQMDPWEKKRKILMKLKW